MANRIFASTPQHLEKIRKHLEEKNITDSKTKYFRGLGSVDLDILDSQCVDPETRELTTLSAEYAEAALAVFENLKTFSVNSKTNKFS